jgi:hypothetical protein
LNPFGVLPQKKSALAGCQCGRHTNLQALPYWVMENRGALDRAFVQSPVSLPDSCEGSVAITSEIPTRVTVSLKMRTAGLVVLSDLFHPGWKAYLNGKRAPILRTDHALRGVVVPAGMGTLEFQYQPASFRIGLVLAGCGALLLPGWIWFLNLERARSGAKNQSP